MKLQSKLHPRKLILPPDLVLYVEVLCDVARDPDVVYPEELDHLRRGRDVPRSARTRHPQPARAAGRVAVESYDIDNARVPQF